MPSPLFSMIPPASCFVKQIKNCAWCTVDAERPFALIASGVAYSLTSVFLNDYFARIADVQEGGAKDERKPLSQRTAKKHFSED